MHFLLLGGTVDREIMERGPGWPKKIMPLQGDYNYLVALEELHSEVLNLKPSFPLFSLGFRVAPSATAPEWRLL